MCATNELQLTVTAAVFWSNYKFICAYILCNWYSKR